MLRRLDAPRRFLLKRMHDPHLLAESHCIHDAERVTAKWKGDLEHASPQAVQRLRNVCLATLGRDRQCGQADRPGPGRERLECFERRLEPGHGPRWSRHVPSLIPRARIGCVEYRGSDARMLSYLPTHVKPEDRPNTILSRRALQQSDRVVRDRR